MATNTDNLQLYKGTPGSTTETFNVEKLNENWDKIDSSMADLAKINKNVSILSANWIDDTGVSGYWYYQIADATVDVDTVVDIYFSKEDLDGTAKTAKVSGGVDSFAGYYRLYAKLKPAADMIVDVKKIRQVI